MTKTVHIVLDTSGSMTEDSKHHSAIYLLLHLRRFFKQHGISVTEWQWSDTLTPLGALQSLPWSGALDAYAFSSFYGKDEILSQNAPILLLSDGDFPISLDLRSKDLCFLLLLGEEEHRLHYHFPKGRLWLPPDLNGHLSLFLAKQVGGAEHEI